MQTDASFVSIQKLEQISASLSKRSDNSINSSKLLISKSLGFYCLQLCAIVSYLAGTVAIDYLLATIVQLVDLTAVVPTGLLCQIMMRIRLGLHRGDR